MKTPRSALPLIAATLLVSGLQARAEASHSNGAALGQNGGYTKSLSSTLLLRGDLVSLPSLSRDSIEEGVSHTGHVKADRGALFMDWHFAGSLRVTGGLTFNRVRMDLRAGGNGSAPAIGDIPYTTAANDRLDVAIRYPNTTPYLGMGYSHHGRGGTFLFDVGGSIGRPSLGDTQSGPFLGNASQAELDRELALLRDGISRVRFMPQISLGMNLKF